LKLKNKSFPRKWYFFNTKTMNFKEVQRFNQWWLWMLLIGIGLIPIYGIYKQLIIGQSFGDKPLSNQGLIAFTIILFLVIGLFGLIRLKTEIDHSEIRMSFNPFVKKKVKLNDVKTMKVVNYGFVGGWGIRLWTKYGTVYNIKGNKGLSITLKDGNKFIIGTQKETELKSVLKSLNL